MTTANAPRLSQARYAGIAMLLHWTIAVLILIQIGLGYYMNEILPDHSAAQDRIQNLHISVGLTTLLLIAVRIGVRLFHPPPPLRADMPGWEKVLARFTHLLFYALLVVLPLSGWAIVSLEHGPIGFWGLSWPRLPGLGFLNDVANRPFRKGLAFTHTHILIYITLANLFLHIAGALKHQFDGRPVLWRMVPFLKAPTA